MISMRYTVRPYISFFLANHDWRFQMCMKDHEKLVITRLEEHVLDITEQHILGNVSVVSVCIPPSTTVLTDFLCSHGRLVAKPILMNLHFPRQAFAIRGGPHENFRKLVWSPTFHLDQDVLLDDVCEFLPLLLALVHFLFEVSYLPANNVEPMAICGFVRDGTDEGGIGIFEGLALGE